jgi:hypothetical protein
VWVAQRVVQYWTDARAAYVCRTHLVNPLRFLLSIQSEPHVHIGTHRAGGPRTLEDRNILDMMIQKKSGEITLELTDEQYAKLRKA